MKFIDEIRKKTKEAIIQRNQFENNYFPKVVDGLYCKIKRNIEIISSCGEWELDLSNAAHNLIDLQYGMNMWKKVISAVSEKLQKDEGFTIRTEKDIGGMTIFFVSWRNK